MGVYDKKTGFDIKYLFGERQMPSLPIVLAVLAVIFLLGLFFLGFFSTKPIIHHFEKNQISSTEQAILVVGVSNVFDNTLNNVTVKVFPEDQTSISVLEPTRTIEVLDKYREMTFLVNPVGPVLPGNYIINISAEMNGQLFLEKAVLTIN